MNIQIYTKSGNSYFIDTMYPSGKRTGKNRITKKEYHEARESAILNADLLTDLVVSENDFYYTEIKTKAMTTIKNSYYRGQKISYYDNAVKLYPNIQPISNRFHNGRKVVITPQP